LKRGPRPNEKLAQRVEELLRQGYTNKEMMHALNLSRTGVHYHVAKLFKQAGLYGNDTRRFMVWLLLTKKLNGGSQPHA